MESRGFDGGDQSLWCPLKASAQGQSKDLERKEIIQKISFSLPDIPKGYGRRRSSQQCHHCRYQLPLMFCFVSVML